MINVDAPLRHEFFKIVIEDGIAHLKKQTVKRIISFGYCLPLKLIMNQSKLGKLIPDSPQPKCLGRTLQRNPVVAVVP